MGGAATVTVTGGMLREAMTPLAERLAATVRKVMESTPPELASSLSDFGILMTGGSALLAGLPEYIGDTLGVRVARSRSPMTDVATGILQLMENGELRRYVTSRAR
jgi:rod shape-determining protein MreB